MGGSGSRTSGTYNVFVHNADFTWIKITEGGGEGERVEWVQSGREAHFQYKEKGYSRLLIQVISDPNAENPKVLSQVTLYSHRDHSWVVKTDGVHKQKYGGALDEVEPNGDKARWSFVVQRKKRSRVQSRRSHDQLEVIHVEEGLLKQFLQQQVNPVSNKIMKLIIQEEGERTLRLSSGNTNSATSNPFLGQVGTSGQGQGLSAVQPHIIA